jgi:hypothetical protein
MPVSLVLVTSRALCFVVVVGCSRPPAASLPISSTPPSVHVDDCVTRSDAQYPPSADSIAITGDIVELCFGVRPNRSCWHVDVGKQVFSPLADGPKPVESHATGTLRPDGGLELCPPAGARCKSIANPSANPHPDWVAVSDDLALIALPDASGPTMRVFDVATGRTHTMIKGWADSPMSGDAFNDPPTFATPDRMIVWFSWTPESDQGRIYDLAGKQLAIIGHEFTSIDPGKNSWHLAGTEWVIKGEANTIATVDVRDLKRTSIYDITALRALPRPPADADTGILDVLAIAGGNDRMIIVTGENPVTIGVLDRATKKLVKLDPPRCGR